MKGESCSLSSTITRVRHIRLCIPVSNLQKVIQAIDGEFPMLEYMYIEPLANDDESIILPETLRAVEHCIYAASY